jgi:hypothetical protein
MTSSPYDNSVQAGQVVELLLAKRAIRFHPIRRAGVRATVARVGDIGLSRACTPAEFAGRTKKCGRATVPPPGASGGGCSQVTAIRTRFAETKLSTAPILRRRFHRASYRAHCSNRRRAFFGLAVVRSATAPQPSRSQSLSWHATLTLREYDLLSGFPSRRPPAAHRLTAASKHRCTTD